ncbi:MAG: MATE family efflux transporter [Candidatus Latescibacterota bacterium]
MRPPLAGLRRRWEAEGGYREFLRVAIPLILTTASWSIQHFVNRVFLAWYSTEALAAAMPAGMASFAFLSLFMGTAQYANTFVAQYMGARRPERVGPAVWQAVHLGVASGVLALVPAAVAGPLFELAGHEAAIRPHEATYFRILCYGTGPQVVSTATSCFFSGRGQTWVMLVVNVLSIGINIVLDYGLIFGRWGLPEMGIAGAAWATNTGVLVSAVLYLLLFLGPRYRAQYATLRGWRPEAALFGRLLRFGGPNGLNFMLDVLAFALFMLVVGRVGTMELAATNLAFNINSLAFMPLIGCGIAVSTMVGQRLGRSDPEGAEYCTWTGFHLGATYMAAMVVGYVLVPDLFLVPFGLRSQGAEFAAARDLAAILLRFVAVYCLSDAFYMVFTAALKGAGDTRYIMWLSVALAWCIMVIPSYVALAWFDAGIFTLWGFVCAYVVVMGVVFYLRFRTGRWKSMRVIEDGALPDG